MHVEFLLIDNGKMSKSLGNVYTLDDLEKKGIEPLSYRYLSYTSHYRNKLNFTWDGIKSAQVSLNRLREMTIQHKGKNSSEDKKELDNKITEYEKRFRDAINDDINMPIAMSVVWEVAKEQDKSN